MGASLGLGILEFICPGPPGPFGALAGLGPLPLGICRENPGERGPLETGLPPEPPGPEGV